MSEQRKVEYQEKWSYIRHMEGLRYKVVQWYFVVVAALGSFAFAEFGHDLATPEWQIVLLFIILYSGAIAGFLVTQKVAYQRYVNRVYELDGTADAGGDRPGADPAFWFFVGILLVGSLATFSFFSCALGWSTEAAVILPISYLLTFAGYYGWKVVPLRG